MNTNEEMHGVTGIANGMSLDVLVVVDDRAGEGHAAGVVGRLCCQLSYRVIEVGSDRCRQRLEGAKSNCEGENCR